MTAAAPDGLDFGRDGAVVLRGLIPRHALPDLPVRSVAPSDGRRQDLWRHHRSVRELARHPAIMAAVADLYGRRPIPFQTLNFDRGTAQPLHADTLHFDSVPSGLVCGAWVALEPVGPDQGPLRIVPGSHLLPAIGPDQVRGPDGRVDMARYERAIAAQVADLAAIEVLAEPGDVVIWDGRLAHGGAPVLDPTSTRRSQVTHYFVEGCAYVTPMRSRPSEGRYFLRDPLVDLSTGRWVHPTIGGRRARPVHGRDGLSRLDDSGPVAPAERLTSVAVAALRHARAAAQPALARRLRLPQSGGMARERT